MVSARPAASSVDMGVDWGWRIVGDAAVRPTQAFSLNNMTYLQMPPGKANVVLMADGVLANHRLYPPYLVVAGTPNRIDLVVDGYRAVVTRAAAPGVNDDRVIRAQPATTESASQKGSGSRIMRVPQ